MANAPERLQIVAEEFEQKDQDLVSKIADSFNNYVAQLNAVLDQNLTFVDNLRCDLRTVTVVGGQTLKFKYAKSDKPIGLWVINYSNLTNPSEVLTTAVQANWDFDGMGNVTIKSVTGLTSGNQYAITIIVISG